jgi:hypothetical protein
VEELVDLVVERPAAALSYDKENLTRCSKPCAPEMTRKKSTTNDPQGFDKQQHHAARSFHKMSAL